MWSITACVFPSVEYLYSTIFFCLLPRYVGSGMSWPLESVMYPVALIRFGLWWVGMYCSGRIYYGVFCGWFAVFDLSFWRPSSSGWRICGSCDAVASAISGLSVANSLIGVLPISTPIIGHLPRLWFVVVYGEVGRCCCVVWF